LVSSPAIGLLASRDFACDADHPAGGTIAVAVRVRRTSWPRDLTPELRGKAALRSTRRYGQSTI
jgi:hypothetical protein